MLFIHPDPLIVALLILCFTTEVLKKANVNIIFLLIKKKKKSKKILNEQKSCK